MPNWCFNSVSVTGPRADLADIHSKIIAKGSFLAGLYPIKALSFDWFNGLSVVDAEWDYGSWCEFYGTKWDDTCSAQQVNIDHFNVYGHSILSANFDTAWAPPEVGIENISTQYPNCVFGLAYHEPGMDFAGFTVIQDGVIIDEDSSSYPDCGDWDNDFDGACERQNEFESGWVDTMESIVSSFASQTKVKLL